MHNEDKPKTIFEQALLEQNRGWLTAYALSMTGDRQSSEDLVQEVFTTALNCQERYDGSHAVGAWLRGIARNKIREYWRKTKRLPVLVDMDVLESLDLAATAVENRCIDPDYVEQRSEALRTCIGRLTARVREMLRLRYEKGHRSQEIGLSLKMSASAVDMGLSRARKALRECIRTKMGLPNYE